MCSELESQKCRLNRVRASIREMLGDVHARLKASSHDKVETNVINQKKIIIGENWKVLDNFRCQYNKKFASYKLIEREQLIHSKKTSECYDTWEKQKNTLMRLYDELKTVSRIENPKTALAAAGQ